MGKQHAMTEDFILTPLQRDYGGIKYCLSQPVWLHIYPIKHRIE